MLHFSNCKTPAAIFSFSFFALLSFSSPLFAGPATVTNDGNIQVRVQYKTGDSDYQDMYLKPGESKELPGGVEKVKVVRNPGEWAKPDKPGETISVTVKQDGQTVGTSKWYGDKVFFSQPTPSPAVQITTPAAGASPKETIQPAVKTSESVTPGSTSTSPTTPAGAADSNNTTPVQPLKHQDFSLNPIGGCAPADSKAESGTIVNNGYLTMTLTFQKGDVTIKEIFLDGFGKSAKIPDGATGVTIREPMMWSGYTAGLKAVNIEVVKPSGEKTNVDKTPFREGAVIDLTGNTYRYQLNWKPALKPNLRLDASGFGDEVNSWKKNSKINSSDVQVEQIEPQNRSLQYKF